MSDWNVASWLSEIGLKDRYAQSFIDNGYDLPNLCANLKDEDLDAIEVSQEDRNELFRHVGRLRHWSVARKPIAFDNSLNSSTISSVNSVESFEGSSTAKSSCAELQQQPADSLSASNELSVKSPDSLRSVSNELPDPTAPSKTEESDMDCKSSAMHAPKKPPRSFKHRVPPPPLPTSPTSSQGLSRLQLKLKLRQELQKDHIVITEHPYVQESGELNSALLQQLAVNYAEKFSVDSLEVYEALAELWKVQTNRTGQVTPMAPELLSPGHKISPVQKPPTAPIAAYMDPYNGPLPPQRKPSPRRKISSDKGSTKPNGSVAKSSAVTSPRDSLENSQMSSEIFLYEDVDGIEDIGPSRGSSSERDIDEKPSFIKSSESVPSFATHLAVEKPAVKKKGFKKFLMRTSKKKNSVPTISSEPASSSDLKADSITMSDEKRLELLEKFKNNELSESEVLEQVKSFEEKQKNKRDSLLHEINEDVTPPIPPPRSSDMLISNGVAGHGSLLSVGNGNLKRAKSSEAIDSTSLTSSGSSGELEHPAVTNKSSPGVIASALKLFRKKRDGSFIDKSKLSHSSSMPAIVIDGMLNEKNLSEVPKIKSGNVAPISAYSEVFDRVTPPSGEEFCSQTTSLPRSNANNSQSSNSSSSTLPSPSIGKKNSPPTRYHKQKLNANKNNLSKSSPLVKQSNQSNPKVPGQRMSSPELTTYPIKEKCVETLEHSQQVASVPMYADVWDKIDDPVTLPTSMNDQLDASNHDSAVLDSFNTPDLGTSPPKDKPQPLDRLSRPKPMPKPALPRKPNVQSVPQQPRPVCDVKPIPRPRSRGDSCSEFLRRSQSPQLSDVFDEQDVPPEKPPRRSSTQLCSNSSRSTTPSPLGFRVSPSPLLTTGSTANGYVVRPPSRENRPALPPKPKPRVSSSSTVGLESTEVQVADRLAVNKIDLAELPYSSTWGECGIPIPLITRYAYELNTSFDQMTISLDKVRKHRLEQCQRVWVPMDKEYTATHDQKPDTANLNMWLASVGLPMYLSQLEKRGIRTVDGVRKISGRAFDQIQFHVPSHSQLLHKAIESLRNEH